MGSSISSGVDSDKGREAYIEKFPGAKQMIKEAIAKIVARKDLTQPEMTAAFEEIMSGVAEPAQIAALITGLRIKGETADEITAAAKVMRKFAAKIDVKDADTEHIVDTCGTGGGAAKTVNIFKNSKTHDRIPHT